MTDQRTKNKNTAMEFYDLMFNHCDPEEAIKKFTGDVYIQHNPDVADGKEAFIGISKEWRKSFPEKGLSLKE
jgi:predicted SnoaL-like aldol condensation-catalyzing enzyme